MFWRRRARTWGMLLLGAWLIATGALQLINLSVPGAGPILAVLAVVAGGCILFDV